MQSADPVISTAFVEKSNVARGTNIRWRGRSFAASVPSDSPKHQRSNARISKHERRVMVESFVQKYRASNGGRFPTPTLIRKQLGGSYYVIRQILQKLEYEHKEFTVKRMDKLLLEEAEEAINWHRGTKDEPEALTLGQEISTATEINGHHLNMQDKPSSATVIFTSHEQRLKVEGNSDLTDKAEAVVSKYYEVEQPEVGEVLGPTNTPGISSGQILEDKDDSSIGDLSLSDRRLEKEGKEIVRNKKIANDKDLDKDPKDQDSLLSARRAPRSRKKSRKQTGITSDDQNSSPQYSVHDPMHHNQEKQETDAKVWFPVPEELASRKTDAISPEGLRDSSGSETGVVLNDQEGFDTECSHRDLPKELEHEESLQQKPTVWQNLKALADGFFDFWKKL